MTEAKRPPFLSMVICSRNDNHGGNMLRRMQVSISGLLEQLERYCIESELILVDWNPPVDKPLLKEAIKWPSGLEYCTIRVIEVNPSIHRRYEYHDKIPMHGVVALNCGIRRARGEFILPGSIDLLYSDELISFIASKVLKADERYRVDRCDVDRMVLQFDTLREQLEYCKKNIIRVHSFQLNFGEGFPELHTNACGDFQLMSRRYWHLLRGCREVDMAAAYVDGLLSYASHAAGVKEVVLDNSLRLYHIDHDDNFNERLKERPPLFQKWARSRFMPRPIGQKLIALYHDFFGHRNEIYGIPALSYSAYKKICREIVEGKRSYIINDETWGLGREELEENVIVAAGWDKDFREARMSQLGS